jgi:hypothetical protein
MKSAFGGSDAGLGGNRTHPGYAPMTSNAADRASITTAGAFGRAARHLLAQIALDATGAHTGWRCAR